MQKKNWCLFGTNKDGLYWETDDFEAPNEDAAKEAAIDYLVNFNEEQLPF
jgi:hypothetical protein